VQYQLAARNICRLAMHWSINHVLMNFTRDWNRSGSTDSVRLWDWLKWQQLIHTYNVSGFLTFHKNLFVAAGTL